MNKFKPNSMFVCMSELDKARGALQTAFLWIHSPQGWEFWDNVDKQLETIQAIAKTTPEEVRNQNKARPSDNGSPR